MTTERDRLVAARDATFQQYKEVDRWYEESDCRPGIVACEQWSEAWRRWNDAKHALADYDKAHKEDAVMEAQTMANIHKIETRAVEYSRQWFRILTRNPLMAESELAAKLGKSPQRSDERDKLLAAVKEVWQQNSETWDQRWRGSMRQAKAALLDYDKAHKDGE